MGLKFPKVPFDPYEGGTIKKCLFPGRSAIGHAVGQHRCCGTLFFPFPAFSKKGYLEASVPKTPKPSFLPDFRPWYPENRKRGLSLSDFTIEGSSKMEPLFPVPGNI